MSPQYRLLKSLKYALVLSCVGMLAASDPITPTPLALPGGESGIGFDDMGFAPSIHKVLVPAGRSGNLELIDPDTKQVTSIGGFSSRASFGGGHGQGVTSADEGQHSVTIHLPKHSRTREGDEARGPISGCFEVEVQKNNRP
jgi:hypothetical protein